MYVLTRLLADMPLRREKVSRIHERTREQKTRTSKNGQVSQYDYIALKSKDRACFQESVNFKVDEK